ncbi:MAG: hypothetical protein ACI9IP_001476 [Arcticibacterium sp.]|jgi:hypothetical protein
MKKIIIAIGLYFALYCGAQAQNLEKFREKANQNYFIKNLKLEEINFVTSYYQQDGNTSAVTGGIGTEALFNVGNSLDVTLSLKDKIERVHTLNGVVNIDAYTSASSDNIDPATNSGASRSDVHVYPSLTYAVQNPTTGITKSFGISGSYEYDYYSIGLNAGISKLSKDKNTEIGLKAGAFFDQWKVILPYELRPPGQGDDDDNYGNAPRNSFNAGLTLSRVVNKNLQVLLMIEPSFQDGLLSTPYHRVYFSDGTHSTEKLPSQRFKLPIGMRASYFLRDNIILRGFYRYYMDNWGMTGHTASFEVPIKMTPFASISPFYRFNRQTAVDYFNAFGEANASSQYHTSDYDISGFDSHYLGLGFRKSTPGGVLGIKHFNAFEFRAAYYKRSTGMQAGIASLLLKIK